MKRCLNLEFLEFSCADSSERLADLASLETLFDLEFFIKVVEDILSFS